MWPFPLQRAIVDAKLEEIQRKAEFAEELKGLREAAQWRKLRGEVSCFSTFLPFQRT
jgi:hypothetical protein